MMWECWLIGVVGSDLDAYHWEFMSTATGANNNNNQNKKWCIIIGSWMCVLWLLAQHTWFLSSAGHTEHTLPSAQSNHQLHITTEGERSANVTHRNVMDAGIILVRHAIVFPIWFWWIVRIFGICLILKGNGKHTSYIIHIREYAT